MSINDLTDQQLLKLRREVVLNSVFTADYRNSLDVPESEAYDFFDGYVSYLEELMSESDPNYDDSMFDERLGEVDTEHNLLDWFAIWLS